MKLNLGCQVHYFDGWTNIDIIGDDPNIKVDLSCDVIKLPYADNSIDFIYAGHLVEHFYPDTLPAAIKEWHRVLREGGTIVIVTPDCGAVFRDYASKQFDSIESVWQQVYGRIYSTDTPSERHHIAFDEWKLFQMVHNAVGGKWSNWHNLDFHNPPSELAPFMDKHISRGWRHYQLGLVMKK